MSDEKTVKKASYRQPPKEHQFKKGNNANPLGAGAHNPALRQLRRLSASEVAEVGTLLILKNRAALEKIIADAQTNPESKHSALKVWIAKVAIQGIRRGDAHMLDILLNRIVGRTTEKIQMTSEVSTNARILVMQMSPEERLEALSKLREKHSEAGED